MGMRQGSEEVTLFPSFCSVPFFQGRTFLPLFLRWQTETLTKIHTQNNHLERPPPRGKVIRGCPPPHTPPYTHTHTHAHIESALPSHFARVSNKTDGQEKKKKKRRGGKKEYRLAFRAPRGPLSSIRDERAAKHQPCSFIPPPAYPCPPHPPTPSTSSVSPGSFVYEETDIMAL